ncbi:MAG: LytR C-terminal domain-containing protein [Aeromicrobium sp.]
MSRTHSGAAIFGAVVLFAVGLFVGFKLLTASADTFEAAPTCENRTVAEGEKLTSNLVTVNVYNASQRSGLANRVSINLQRRGFQSGTVANSTSEIKPDAIAVLTDDRDDPRVKLVAQQFKDVEYSEPDIDVTEGVTVIVGDDYKDLVKAPQEVESDRSITVCVPTVDVS